MLRNLLLAAVLLAVFAAGALVWTLRSLQAAGPSLDDVPAIAVDAPRFPADDDAWSLLEEATEALDRDAAEDYRDLLAEDGPPPPGRGLAWAAQREALESFDAAAARPGIALPIVDLTGEWPDLTGPLELSRAQALRAWHQAEEGDALAAVETLLRAAQLGAHIEHAGQGLLPAAVGAAIQEIAIGELTELLAVWPEPAALARAAEGLAELAAVPSGQLRAVAGECAWSEDLYRQLADDPEMLAADLGDMAYVPTWLYDPDRTIAWQRQRCRALLDALAEPWPEREVPEPEPLFVNGRVFSLQWIDNPVGRILLEVATPDYSRYAERGDELTARKRAAQLQIALLRLQLDGGALPGDAQALAPWLAPIPTDPFAGAPMRWDSDHVWAQGPEELELRWAVGRAEPTDDALDESEDEGATSPL